ncbi:MAG: ribonuclease P protein component 1 [Euryarchaeota archaeon]|nr:ribonuclease P protein component 1 [Euryarchaeota archaeon]
MTYHITPENLIYHTLIGLETVVADSTNPDMVDITGVVVDETRNTLVINPCLRFFHNDFSTRFFHKKSSKNCQDSFSDRIIPKSHTIFIFSLPDGSMVRVNGDLLVARPEDRITKKHRNN